MLKYLVGWGSKKLWDSGKIWRSAGQKWGRGAEKIFLGVAKWNCLLLDIWWLVELLYWFKTNFSLKISGILPCEIQKVLLCEIRFHSKNLGVAGGGGDGMAGGSDGSGKG